MKNDKALLELGDYMAYTGAKTIRALALLMASVLMLSRLEANAASDGPVMTWLLMGSSSVQCREQVTQKRETGASTIVDDRLEVSSQTLVGGTIETRPGGESSYSISIAYDPQRRVLLQNSVHYENRFIELEKTDRLVPKSLINRKPLDVRTRQGLTIGSSERAVRERLGTPREILANSCGESMYVYRALRKPGDCNDRTLEFTFRGGRVFSIRDAGGC